MIEGKRRKKEKSAALIRSSVSADYQAIRKKVKGKRNWASTSYFLPFTFSLFLMVISCSSENSRLEAFEKLEGTWLETSENGIFSESWKLVNDTLMIGSSYMIQRKDTILSEKLQLVFQNDSVYYIPTVSNQNFGKTIRFGLISNKANKWIFENKKHDFPSQIVYTFIGTDSLIATVKGIEKGKRQEYTFRMKKIVTDSL